MDVFELAKRRKTVRKFDKKEVPMDDILHCIEVAKEAPSGMNSQPWRFLIIRNAEVKKKLRELCEKAEKNFHEKVADKNLGKWMEKRNITWKKNFIEDAPLLLLVFSWKAAPYFIQSTWLMLGYLLLALEERGLATVTYTPPNPGEIREFFSVNEDYKLQTILPIGYSLDEKTKEERKELEEMVYMERWGASMR